MSGLKTRPEKYQGIVRGGSTAAKTGRAPRPLTVGRLKAALADLIRWYAGPIRKELHRGPGPSVSVDDGWVS